MGKLEWEIRIKLPPTGEDPAEGRIAAKARLWDFLNDINYELRNWQDSDEELCQQLATSCLHILHPIYRIWEIDAIMRDIYFTIKKPVPAGYVSILCLSFEQFFKARFGNTK